MDTVHVVLAFRRHLVDAFVAVGQVPTGEHGVATGDESDGGGAVVVFEGFAPQVALFVVEPGEELGGGAAGLLGLGHEPDYNTMYDSDNPVRITRTRYCRRVSTATWIRGDVRDRAPHLPDASVDLVATSPPFWLQRGYLPAGHPDKPREIGQEPSPAAYLDVLLELTAEFRRVLTPHGSIAIELGDTMAGSGGAGGDYDKGGFRDGQPRWKGSSTGVGPLAKSHCMIPEAYRFALVYGLNPFTGAPAPAGRWIVRNVVDWCRRNPTPGDDGDKFRRASSDIVVATLSSKRWWDSEPVRIPAGDGTRPLYDWWDLSSDPYPGAHYAVWPPEVARRLIVTMCPAKVCTTCGEPQRRIVTTLNAVGRAAGSQAWIGDTTGELRTDMVNRNAGPDHAIRETVGWARLRP